MQRIACLAWGSLIWNPGDLPVSLPWSSDGPGVRVEFLRQSANGRITLVMDPAGYRVSAYWSLMSVADVSNAREALRKREGIAPRRMADVGAWMVGNPSPDSIPGMATWASLNSINGAVWTALPCKFCGEEGRRPTLDEVLSYLMSLTGATRQMAEEYIRRAPRSVATPYREAIEAKLNWTHTNS